MTVISNMASSLVAPLQRLACRTFCKNSTLSLLKSNRNIYTFNSKASALARRIPVKNQTAFYYVKPKQKKGPTLSGWLKFSGAIVGVITGVIVYIGE